MKHLFQNLEGIENMTQLPDAMFVIDSNAEEIAVKKRGAWACRWFPSWIRIAIGRGGLDHSRER